MDEEMLFKIYELTAEAERRIDAGMCVAEAIIYLNHDLCALSARSEGKLT